MLLNSYYLMSYNFLPIHVQFNGQKLSRFSEKVSFNPHFLFSCKCKICFYEENGLYRSFISNLSSVGNRLVQSTLDT